jgi:hypothetical protein
VMTRSLRLILPALAALLLLVWLLRPRGTTEIPWSIRLLFEPEPTPEWHPQDGTTLIWGEGL